jgi:hypothetical protein
MEKSIAEMIAEETTKRLAVMQSADYVYPEKMNKLDVAGILGIIATSLVLIGCCYFGVIQ